MSVTFWVGNVGHTANLNIRYYNRLDAKVLLLVFIIYMSIFTSLDQFFLFFQYATFLFVKYIKNKRLPFKAFRLSNIWFRHCRHFKYWLMQQFSLIYSCKKLVTISILLFITTNMIVRNLIQYQNKAYGQVSVVLGKYNRY